MRGALDEAGAARAREAQLDPLLARVQAHGLHGFLLDVRDHADVHRRRSPQSRPALRLVSPISSCCAASSPGDVRSWAHTFRSTTTPAGCSMSSGSCARSRRSSVSRRHARTSSRWPGGPTIFSACYCWRARPGWSISRPSRRIRSIDVVPLFETLDDLNRAPGVMRELLDDHVYRRQLEARGRRQEMMIGYSDSAKDAGILAGSLGALSRAGSLAEIVPTRQASSSRLFHGRGGSVGRGGGSPVCASPCRASPGTVRGRIKITEQGEIISQQFGLLPIAVRYAGGDRHRHAAAHVRRLAHRSRAR